MFDCFQIITREIGNTNHFLGSEFKLYTTRWLSVKKRFPCQPGLLYICFRVVLEKWHIEKGSPDWSNIGAIPYINKKNPLISCQINWSSEGFSFPSSLHCSKSRRNPELVWWRASLCHVHWSCAEWALHSGRHVGCPPPHGHATRIQHSTTLGTNRRMGPILRAVSKNCFAQRTYVKIPSRFNGGQSEGKQTKGS